jgi:hypothetical protein
MATLPDSARVTTSGGSMWKTCEPCGQWFPAEPDERYCRACQAAPGRVDRCEAAHPADSSGCEGPAEAVQVLDGAGGRVYGCVRHAAVMLASIAGARVYPAGIPLAAIEVYRRAKRLRPFQLNQAGGDR